MEWILIIMLKTGYVEQVFAMDKQSECYYKGKHTIGRDKSKYFLCKRPGK